MIKSELYSLNCSYGKQKLTSILKILESGGWGPTVLRETVNENYFYQFINTHEINENYFYWNVSIHEIVCKKQNKKDWA